MNNEINLIYKYDDRLHYVYLMHEKDELAYIQYTVKNNVLIIGNIVRTRTGRMPCYDDYYLGTMVFNELLMYLDKQGIRFNEITGELSIADAIPNWIDSIPFYMDFTKYLNEKLAYTLEFRLYNDKEFSHHVKLPFDKPEGKDILNDFIKKHVSNKTDASFKYIVLDK